MSPGNSSEPLDVVLKEPSETDFPAITIEAAMACDLGSAFTFVATGFPATTATSGAEVMEVAGFETTEVLSPAVTLFEYSVIPVAKTLVTTGSETAGEPLSVGT